MVARARAIGAVDPANAPVYLQAAKSTIGILEKAAEKAGELSKTDPDAKGRRGEMLLEIGDTEILAKLFKEAAATYEKVFSEFSGTERAEIALQRQITALHLAGQYAESDALCDKFVKTFPRSILLAAVDFCGAENLCLAAMNASADPKTAENRAACEKKFDNAITRYQKLVGKYPEFNYVNLARYGMGSAQYQRGQFSSAFDTLTSVLDADRNGELAAINYVAADSLMRQFPPETNDALQAALLIDAAEQAARLLEKFAGSPTKTPQVADAMLKLGHCYLRIGELVVDPAERTKLLTQARQILEKLMQEIPTAPAFPAAVLERARCMALMGDVGGAMNEYNRFNGDPLKQHPLAPLAMIRQAELLRTQKSFSRRAEPDGQLSQTLRRGAKKRSGAQRLDSAHSICTRPRIEGHRQDRRRARDFRRHHPTIRKAPARH